LKGIHGCVLGPNFLSVIFAHHGATGFHGSAYLSDTKALRDGNNRNVFAAQIRDSLAKVSDSPCNLSFDDHGFKKDGLRTKPLSLFVISGMKEHQNRLPHHRQRGPADLQRKYPLPELGLAIPVQAYLSDLPDDLMSALAAHLPNDRIQQQ
ncbi:MAG: hypothetical protein RL119_1896, partial [Actinomycetota bacterium]